MSDDETGIRKWIAKGMRLFGEVDAREVYGVLSMFLTLTILLFAYYVLKTVREPLILDTDSPTIDGPQMKAYAAGAQAVVLIFFVPLYGWIASQVSRTRLILATTLFFIVSLEAFWLLGQFEVRYLGFVFFVWVGIFSVSTIAQFWSFANEMYSEADGKRLFPIIAIGATIGAPVGSAIAGWLFDLGVGAYSMMHIAAVLLGVHGALYVLSRRNVEPAGDGDDDEPLAAVGGFKLVLKDPYIRLIAVLLILLNLVNTTGEYILSEYVVDAAKAAHEADASVEVKAYIGSFYGEFFSIVNVATVFLQAFAASRLVKFFGLAGVLFALPIVAFGAYGLAAFGIGFAAFRWAKTAENSTDYSLMNTAKAMLWLPTSAEAKYKAKQAVDTFFVRFGDVLSAGLVFVGTSLLAFDTPQFAIFNVVMVGLWFFVAYRLNRRFVAQTDDEDLEDVTTGVA